jgi:hypothetical protein
MRQILVCGAVAVAALTVASVAGAGSGSQPPAGERPASTTVGSLTNGLRTTNTVPVWASSFTSSGITYPYTMVGTAPASNTTTTVPTVIVPITLHFTAKAQRLASQISTCASACVALDATFDGSSVVQSVVASPIFQPASFPWSGDAGVQYGDAIQRAEFDVVGSRWHTVLGRPQVLPAQSLDVPQNQGVAVMNARGVVSGRVDENWFTDRLLQLSGQLHLSSQVLPIFQVKDVVLYAADDPNSCCFFGFHAALGSRNGNGSQQVQTFVFDAWLTSGFFTLPNLADVQALSHEVVEWMNDPFNWNTTPRWFADGYGCEDSLETGDPLVGTTFSLNGYHLQDEAFLSWFARSVPSTSLDGRYSYLGTFAGPSTGC